MNMGRDIDPEHSRVEELGEATDLLELAMRMRDHGVESLLFADPGGRITRVVTDRQIAALATDVSVGRPVSLPNPRLERSGADQEAASGQSAGPATAAGVARVPSQLPPEPAPVEAERLNHG